MCLKKEKHRGYPGGLVVGDSPLSLLELEFKPWPANFCMSQIQPKKRKKHKRNIHFLYTALLFIKTYIHKMECCSTFKKGNPAVFDKEGRPWGYYAKWNKSDRDKYCMIPLTSQTEKDKYCRILLTYGIWKWNKQKLSPHPPPQIQTQKKRSDFWLPAEGSGGWE